MPCTGLHLLGLHEGARSEPCACWSDSSCNLHTQSEGLCHAGGYICWACAKERAQSRVEVDCGATLIVSPSSILEQWRNEIAKHTREGASLPVRLYGPQRRLWGGWRGSSCEGWPLVCSDCKASRIATPSSITQQWESRTPLY